jgi:hypothetical protein
MREMTFEIGTKMNLGCLKSNPEVIIEKIENNNAFYIFENKKYYSPIESIHCNAEGWYALEVYKVNQFGEKVRRFD